MTSYQFCVLCMILSWAMAFPGCLPKKVVLVGDSTTMCKNHFNPAVSAKATLGEDWEVVNEGIGGTDSLDWKETHAAAVIAKHPDPDYTVVTLGINDWGADDTPTGLVAADRVEEVAGMFGGTVYLTPVHWVDDTNRALDGIIPGLDPELIDSYEIWENELRPIQMSRGYAWEYSDLEKYDGLHFTDDSCEALGVRIGTEILLRQ